MQFMNPIDGFLGLEKKDAAAPQKAEAVIIPFGLETSVSYGGGTAKGPACRLDGGRA